MSLLIGIGVVFFTANFYFVTSLRKCQTRRSTAETACLRVPDDQNSSRGLRRWNTTATIIKLITGEMITFDAR